jgi:hypothetical protein
MVMTEAQLLDACVRNLAKVLKTGLADIKDEIRGVSDELGAVSTELSQVASSLGATVELLNSFFDEAERRGMLKCDCNCSCDSNEIACEIADCREAILSLNPQKGDSK